MRLRRDKARAYCISVNIRYTDFRNKSHQRSLERATDITGEIYTNARDLLTEMWNGKDHLRLMGVALSQLTRDDAEQMSLFDLGNENRERQRKLDRTMDEIRNRFGMDSIKRGAAADVRGHKGK